MSFIGKLFGIENQLKEFQPLVEKINSLEPDFEKLSKEELHAKTRDWQTELKKLDTAKQTKYLEEILPEAFAAVRESAKRTLGQRHYDVQLLGGIVLHYGNVAEMKTGEGKTLASTLPVYLNALTGTGVHVVTVNDYLARRDASWMGQIYHYLGLQTATIQHQESFRYSETDQKDEVITPEEEQGVQVDVKNLTPCSRREAYQADITYGTNNEFGFDYLRDNMARNLNQLVQRESNYAIVDEIDSILIDEARTPLIISAPDVESTELYKEFATFTKSLTPEDYELDEKNRQVTYTDTAYQKLEEKYGAEIYSNVKLRHHADSALRAQTLFKKDYNYVVKGGEVIIVDEFTGRLMPGRRFSEGLHQAIEAKEGVTVQHESKTLATITFQNYFRLYNKLSGMTGTAKTEEEEFRKIYGLDVIEIPTNKPLIRDDRPDSIYKNESGKITAIVREIKERSEKGQPVLVGTISIEKNEELSKILKKSGVKHEILNAKNHAREAEIIAQAGKSGAVTLATNIAGRGVDIILGGNPFDETQNKLVKDAGGLHVVGTERHESRRIDNQLRGRAGRQGDPGSSQFFISAEDDLMRIFGGDRMKNLMETMKIPDDQPIQHSLVSRSVENAQKKIEGMNFDVRKHVLQFDDVLNKQREAIYSRRRKILREETSLKSVTIEKIDKELGELINQITKQEQAPDKVKEEIYKVVEAFMPISTETKKEIQELDGPNSAELWINHLTKFAHKLYEEREQKLTSPVMRGIERAITLQAIDNYWMEHLDTMDHLRQSVRLRGYAQKDPLVEYKKDGLRLFETMLDEIDRAIVYAIFRVEVKPQEQPQPVMQTSSASNNASSTSMLSPASASSSAIGATREKKEKIGRNDPCPCGSGKKYKKCGLKNTAEHQKLLSSK